MKPMYFIEFNFRHYERTYLAISFTCLFVKHDWQDLSISFTIEIELTEISTVS